MVFAYGIVTGLVPYDLESLYKILKNECQFYSSYNSFAIYKQNHIYLWYFCIMPTSVRPQLWFYIYLLHWLSNTDLKVHLQVFYFLISACSAASVALFADSSLIFSDIIAFTLPLYVS